MALRKDIQLSSGRVIRHTLESNGSQLATPTTGYYEMTNDEWAEYCKIIMSNNNELKGD
jgi:hypothetical protein